MKEAMFWKTEGNQIRCELCPQNCLIAEGKVGFCGVRKNIKQKLFSLVYAHPVSMAVDPVEKKPLYHFMPGTKTFSFSTVGCNFGCKFCQNWEIARGNPDEFPTPEVPPEKIVEMALEKGCKSISYTYVEPTIFYEYVYDTAKLAREKGLKNIMVTNGFINEEPLRKLYPLIDAANVDLKAFSEDFYKKVCSGKLQSVLDTLKILKEMNTTWIEVTNLLIPELNDSEEETTKLCNWIKDNLGTDVPLHFSRFFPHYKMKDRPPTEPESLFKAYKIAKKVGLNHVYIGNLFVDKEDDTTCPKCKAVLVRRSGIGVMENKLSNNKGKCSCGEKIAGIWL